MSKQVAEQIFEQIRWYDSSALMAYGARQFAVLDELRGGLQMRVNGIRHKGPLPRQKIQHIRFIVIS